MNRLPVKAKIYIGLVDLIAAGILLISVPKFQVHDGQIYGVLAFIVLSIFSEYLSVTLPYIGTLTVTYAIDLALIITFGVPVAVVASCIGYIGSCFIKFREEETPLVKMVFNLSQFIVTIYASGTAFYYTLHFFPTGTAYIILATAIAALTYLVVNFSVVTFLFAFIEKKSVWGIWIVNVRWALPNFLALAPIGYILGYVYTDIGLLGIFVFFLPLLLARHTFKLYMDMREMYLRTIHSLAATIDAKDHYTAGHSERVARYAVGICEEMALPEDYIENLKDIALLHDIGKISIPEHILNKPGRLDVDEMNKMKGHSAAGYEIVRQINFLKEPEVIKFHHERLDGSGYPDGLQGQEIPLGARIIAVADSFDAMTTDRPYRKGMERNAALQELERCRGTQFDPDVVEKFIKAIPRILEEGDHPILLTLQQKMEG